MTDEPPGPGLRRAAASDRAPLEALQHVAYAANRALLGAEPLPLTVDYGEILRDYEIWLAGTAKRLDGALILLARPGDLLVWSVAVAPHAQGSGLGGALLAAAERRAETLGRDTVRLYTGARLKERVAWYTRRGYAIERREKLPDRMMVHMVKSIAGKGRDTMAGRLKGKVALVTAAGQGIGRKSAEFFAQEGAKVIATDIDVSKLEGLPRGTIKRKLDVRSNRAVEALAEKIGPIDILLNAAGFVHHGTVLTTSDADWAFSFDVNVQSMHRTIKAFLPGMLEKGAGSIINVASGAGSVRGIPNRYVYGATKAAVIGLTKAVAADYIRQGIRANAICPGTIESPSLDQRILDVAKTQKITEQAARQAFIDRQAMGRLGKPEEIAWLAVYLASDESSYTTGQIHLADGGFAL